MSISIISTILFLQAILSIYKQFYCHFIQLILCAWSFFILIFCILYGLLYTQTLPDRFSPFYSTMKSVFKCTGRVWFFQKQSPGGFAKKVFLEISQNEQENTCARVSFFLQLIKKETQAQVSSCEFCEISKNTFSYRTPLVLASVISDVFISG